MMSFRRITAFLKIEAGEERLIGLLALLYFSLALSFVLVQSMAFGVFLSEYGAQGLPYSYISIALVASLLAAGYIQLGERLPFARLLQWVLVFLAAATLLLWLGLNSPLAHQTAFLLPMWFQALINLGNLVVWPLAGRLLNFRQGKRLFGLLGAGMWLANVLGGLLVPLLVRWIGAVHLLLPAVASIGLGFGILRWISAEYLSPQETPAPSKGASRPRRAAARPAPVKGMFKQGYVLWIFFYIVLWWVAFYFVDNIFYDRAAAQFASADQLTAFVGQLLSLTGILALLASTLLVGRIIGRFGLRAGLLGMPLLVTLVLGGLAASASLGAALPLVFGVGALAKLIFVALGFSLSQSANAIVYQALPVPERGRVQATAEGIVQPLAIGLAGAVLLGLTTGLKLGYLGLAWVFLLLALPWLGAAWSLSKRYLAALERAITRHRFGESPEAPPDPASLALLRQHLEDPHPGAALYALAELEELDGRAAAAALPGLLAHPAPEVRSAAFTRIAQQQLKPALAQVRAGLESESDPLARQAGLRALAAITPNAAEPRLLGALDSTDSLERSGALAGLLHYHPGGAADSVLTRLAASSQGQERLLAAQLLADAGRADLLPLLRTLLGDPEVQVRRAALLSAGKLGSPELAQELIAACDLPETYRSAALALSSAADPLLPAIEAAFAQAQTPRLRRLALARALGRSHAPSASSLLQSCLLDPDSELRTLALRALAQQNFRAADAQSILAGLELEARLAARLSADQVTLDVPGKTALLQDALSVALQELRERMLLQLSFLPDAQALLRARDALLSGSSANQSYALEIIETQIPADWKPLVMPVLEDLPPAERLERLQEQFPQPAVALEDCLCRLIAGQDGAASSRWLQVCAIYSAARLRASACLAQIQQAAAGSDVLLRETGAWALERLEPQPQKESVLMYSILERVLILKTVSIFSQTPDEVLADVAALMVEEDVEDGEEIFSQGDLGDSLYVIVDGRVRVHEGERLLNYLGERDVFGEMALLDPEPRLASVTAVAPTLLLRLEQAPFYQLLDERPEIAKGILRVLTRRLRDRVRDLTKLEKDTQALRRQAGNSERP